MILLLKFSQSQFKTQNKYKKMDDLEEAEICFSSYKYLEALECLNRIQEPAEVYFMQGKC